MSEDEQSYHGPENFGRFVDRDMQPCTWEVELRQMLERKQHLSGFGYQRMLRMLVAFAPKLFEELDKLRAPQTAAPRSVEQKPQERQNMSCDPEDHAAVLELQFAAIEQHQQEHEALKLECAAWRKLAAWQTADRRITWFDVNPGVRTEPEMHAYIHGTIIARGAPVDVARELGLLPQGR